jgi:hypothetical protein
MSQNRLGIATVVLLVFAGLTFWRMNGGGHAAQDRARQAR